MFRNPNLSFVDGKVLSGVGLFGCKSHPDVCIVGELHRILQI